MYGRKKTLPVSETSGKLANAKSEQFGDENFRSRTRLNGGLWLRCRLSLVKNLIDQVKGLGQIPGRPIHYAVSFISSSTISVLFNILRG